MINPVKCLPASHIEMLGSLYIYVHIYVYIIYDMETSSSELLLL